MRDLRRVRPAREDRPHMHPAPAQLLPEHLLEAVERKLRCNIGRIRRDALFAIHGGGDHDAACMPREHVRQNGIHRVERAKEIRFHDSAYLRHGEVLCRAAEVDARIAECRIDLPEIGERRRDCRSDLLLCGRVRKVSPRFHAQCPRFFRNRLQTLIVARHKRKGSAFLCKRKRRRTADAA